MLYNFFLLVGEPLRNVPSPGENLDSSTSPIPQHLTRTVSPLPKWARGIFNFFAVHEIFFE